MRESVGRIGIKFILVILTYANFYYIKEGKHCELHRFQKRMRGKRMSQKVKAVIFDQDGLMFDTERVSTKAWHMAESQFGVTISEELLSSVRGSSIPLCRRRFIEEFGEDFDFYGLLERKQHLFHTELRVNGLPVKKGLKELLVYLKDNSCKISLATSSFLDWSVKNLEISGITEYFDEIVCGDMVKNCKPDPEIFLLAASKLGEKPENCVVLEDSLNGISAALSGGFQAVMVPDLMQPDELLAGKLTALCSSLLEVRNLFADGILILD